MARFRLIDWPVLARPLGLAAALAMAMSLGDLGVITLFGSENFITLPYLLLQRMGLSAHRRRGGPGAGSSAASPRPDLVRPNGWPAPRGAGHDIVHRARRRALRL